MSDKNNGSPDLETMTISKLAEILKESGGNLNISLNKSPALSIFLGSNKIQLDVHDPSIFENIRLEKGGRGSGFSGLFEKLKTAQKFAEILNNTGLSLIVSRKGKEAFTIGRAATPTVSSILTGSDDIHIDSIAQTAKLGKDLSDSRKNK